MAVKNGELFLLNGCMGVGAGVSEIVLKARSDALPVAQRKRSLAAGGAVGCWALAQRSGSGGNGGQKGGHLSLFLASLAARSRPRGIVLAAHLSPACLYSKITSHDSAGSAPS